MTHPFQRLRSWWRLHREDREHRDEVAFHLDMLVERHLAAGLSPADAQRRASLEFGSRVAAREAVRQEHRGSLLDDGWRDLVHGSRQLAGHPGFTLAVVSTLALAIGAATAVFSVADHVLLRASPYREGERLVVAWQTDRASGTMREPAALPDWLDVQRGSRTLASLDAAMGSVGTLERSGSDPIRVAAMYVSPGWFGTLGISPLRGRHFTPAEGAPGGGSVVLISESMWRARLDADPNIIGAQLRLNDVATEVIGIVPDDADHGLDQLHAQAAYHATYEPSGRVDVWLPLQATEAELSRDTHPLLLVGRLAPGSSVGAAQAELAATMADLETQHPRSNRNRGAFVEPFTDVIHGASRPLLLALLAAVAVLALVATVNVASLLLVRGAGRAKEVALRTALGATAQRLARQFSVEAALLVTLGVAGGLAVAWGAVRVVRVIGPADVPRLAETSVDIRAMAVAIALAGVIGAIFSLLPALTAFRNNPVATLKDEGGATTMNARGHRLRNALVAGELALCVTLAVGATLVVRSFRAAASVDPGFSAADVVKVQYELPASRYPRDFARFPNFVEINQFTERTLRAARTVPGVESAAIAAAHPLDEGFTNSWRVVGRETEGRDWPEISVRIISPGYEGTMGREVRSGRAFSEQDAGNAVPVAVINETAARRFFAGADPIGQQLAFWGIARQIVGVVADERIHGVDAASPPAVYVPMAQAPGSSGVLLVRSSRVPAALLSELRQVIATVDPQLAVYGAEPLTQTAGAALGQRRFAMVVMGAFALLTVILALVGVQGVTAHVATARERELGIRMALGARAPAVAGMVLAGTFRIALLGVALGTAGAAAGGGILASLLFGVSRYDLATFVSIPATILAVAILAGMWPAWRAVRRAPFAAIR
jgi:putative ABC transport system permease protein